MPSRRQRKMARSKLEPEPPKAKGGTPNRKSKDDAFGKYKLKVQRISPRPNAATLSAKLRSLANPQQARILQSFFKTGPGQYAAGDIFLGVKVPAVRKLVREFRAMHPRDALKLVRSEIHEERLAGLLLWVQTFQHADSLVRQQIFNLYCRHRRHVNNWDLVDLSAPNIVGALLSPGEVTLLRDWAGSPVVWDRRIAVLATFAFIRRGVFGPTLELCRALLSDRHDLMHKACGWMLREIGKRDRDVLSAFLRQHGARMPRTMLRYALEHYPPIERARFLLLGNPVKRHQ